MIREEDNAAGLPDRVDNLDAWLDEWNTRLEEIEPMIEDLQN